MKKILSIFAFLSALAAPAMGQQIAGYILFTPQAAPGSLANGMFWYDSGSSTFRGYVNGSSKTFAYLGVAQSWSAVQTFGNGDLSLSGSSSGSMLVESPAAASGTASLVPGTEAVLGTAQSWTAAQSFTDGDLLLLGSGSGSATIHGPATGGGSITLVAGTEAITSQLTPSGVSLGNVTNDAQTKAAIMPNAAPSAGQIPVGNAGGTAYAPASMSGDATMASTGAVTNGKFNGGTSFGSAAGHASTDFDASGAAAAINNISAAPSNGAYKGIVVTYLNSGGSSLTFGEAVTYNASGNWVAADCSTPTVARGLSVAAVGSSSAASVLEVGVATNSGWSWTVGGVIYLSTAGALTQSAPSTSGYIIQQVGIALSSTTAFFNFTNEYLTHS